MTAKVEHGRDNRNRKNGALCCACGGNSLFPVVQHVHSLVSVQSMPRSAVWVGAHMRVVPPVM